MSSAILISERENMLKTKSVVAGVLLASVLLSSASFASAQTFPEQIPLPNAFQPEGIASGRGSEFFAGSLANGAIYKGDFRTGTGDVLAAGVPGRISVGMKFDSRTGYLFVAGGPTGVANIFNGDTGALVATYQLAPAGSFINDVIITRDAAYFTQSNGATLYKLPLGPGGELPNASAVQALPLSGDWQQVAGFNANGITATPNGKTLIVVNSTLGQIFNVDPNTGVATRIAVSGEDNGALTAGDGILLDGKTLYVLRNRLNKIAVVDLDPKYTSGVVTREITSPLFRVPTTLAEFGNRLYAVNARFGTPPGPNVDYDVVQVSK
jgi:sugar lactone lactonase YvrE